MKLTEDLWPWIQAEQHVAASCAAGQVSDVAGLGQSGGDLLGSVDAPHLNETRPRFNERGVDDLSGLGLTLGTNHRRLTFL